MSLTHLDNEGRARMVDVGGKQPTVRVATASAFVRMNDETIRAIKEHKTPKGDPLETARIAGIMAAKKTSELIPLCHPLPLNQVDIDIEIEDTGIKILASARTEAKTGVEMEAMVAAATAALTIYDMCKALDKSIVISEVRLESKSGGKSGDYVRSGN